MGVAMSSFCFADGSHIPGLGRYFEDCYTTKLDKSTIPQQLKQYAEFVASSITANPSTNVHVAGARRRAV